MEPLPQLDASPPGLTPRDGMVIFLVALLGAVGFSVLAGAVCTIRYPLDSPQVFAATAYGGQFGFCLAVIFGLRRSAARTDLALRSVPVWQLALAAVGLVCFSPVGDWVGGRVSALLPDYEGTLPALSQFLSQCGPAALAVAAISFTLLPAVIEEGLFRGVLYRAFEPLWGGTGAVIVPSLLFALVHLDPVQSSVVLILGWYLALLRRYTGSLYPCIAAHAANNLVAILMLQRYGLESLRLVSPAATGAGAGLGLLALFLLARRRR